MEKNKKEMLEKLRNVKSMEEYNLEMMKKSDEIEIDDVKYLGEAFLEYEENGEKEVYKINVYAVIEGKTIKYYSDDMPLAAETENIGNKESAIIPSPEYEKIFEKNNPIRDIIEDLKQKEMEDQEKPEEEKNIVSLNDLEAEKEQEKDGEEEKTAEDIEEQEKTDDLKISNIKGQVDLDQQVNGETLRKILGLSEEYKSIAPIRSSTIGIKEGSKYHFVAIKNDGTCTILEENVLEEDKQKGKNPYEKDLMVNNDGSLTQESSISNFRIPRRPNLVISVRFDENSSTRETTITDVSGRESRDEDIAYEFEKEGDGWQDPDARESRMTEDGIDASDKMVQKQKEHEDAGCDNDRIENIDEDKNNDDHVHIDPEQKIEGTDITWEQFADMCGHTGNDKVEKVYEEFKEYEADHKDLENEEIVRNIVAEKNREVEKESEREEEYEGRVPWDSGRRRI